MTGRGFTLLEVMIAVAILGLSLTAIFSSEVGAANLAARARRQNVAATLARCKMGEIEQIIAIEGLPAIEKKDTDNCCEHAPVEGFECDWLVERIILPEFGAKMAKTRTLRRARGMASTRRTTRSRAKAAPRKR